MTTRTALSTTLLLPLLAVGCGGSTADQAKATEQTAAAESNFDPCALLTYQEISSVLGWAPDSSRKQAYGTTGNCTYYGPNALTQTIALLVGQGMPDMSDATKMAEWRAKQYVDYGVKDAVVEPLEGLGVPAIRNEFGVVAIEMAVGSQLVSVSSIAANFDQVRTLAGFVLNRMK